MQRTRPLGAIILVNFEKKFSFGAVNPTLEPIKVKFGRKVGPLLPAKFDLDQCNVSPLRGPQYRPVIAVSKRNTGRAALRADPAGNKNDFNRRLKANK